MGINPKARRITMNADSSTHLRLLDLDVLDARELQRLLLHLDLLTLLRTG
jgi:hypothetical protein